MFEREGQGERYSNKKIEALRSKRKLWAERLEAVEEDLKWHYKLQVTIADYDIENAVKNEAKRQTRKALRHIEKKLTEIKDLREQVATVLFEDGVLDWTERMIFKDELDKVFDMHKVAYGESSP